MLHIHPFTHTHTCNSNTDSGKLWDSSLGQSDRIEAAMHRCPPDPLTPISRQGGWNVLPKDTSTQAGGAGIVPATYHLEQTLTAIATLQSKTWLLCSMIALQLPLGMSVFICRCLSSLSLCWLVIDWQSVQGVGSQKKNQRSASSRKNLTDSSQICRYGRKKSCGVA